jgi:RNA polymerase primary sigma factor
VLETLDTIADTFKRLRRLQDRGIHDKLHNESLSPAQQRKYKKLKKEIIAEVKSLRLNQARICALVEQLYDIKWRRTCASSFPSPRDTPTAVYSFST